MAKKKYRITFKRSNDKTGNVVLSFSAIIDSIKKTIMISDIEKDDVVTSKVLDLTKEVFMKPIETVRTIKEANRDSANISVKFGTGTYDHLLASAYQVPDELVIFEISEEEL